jgi:hypothetical protein
MRLRYVMWVAACGVLTGFFGLIFAQSPPSSGNVPVSLIVSIQAKSGQQVPTIEREDVSAFLAKEKVPVAGWTPLQGNQAGLDLLILVDDGIDSAVASQFESLRQFMNAQPATTSMAVGYIHYGFVEVVQNFTHDHALAGRALRIPMGGTETTSPYLAISDYVRDHWPISANRHEILLISDGADELEVGPNPMSVETAVEQAQQAGIQIFTIYAGRAGQSSDSWWRTNWGQDNLAQISGETGGESYGLMPSPPVGYEPFLREITDRLDHQYLLTLSANQAQAGTYQQIHLETELSNAELDSAAKVYVPIE